MILASDLKHAAIRQLAGTTYAFGIVGNALYCEWSTDGGLTAAAWHDGSLRRKVADLPPMPESEVPHPACEVYTSGRILVLVGVNAPLAFVSNDGGENWQTAQPPP